MGLGIVSLCGGSSHGQDREAGVAGGQADPGGPPHGDSYT